MPLTRRKPLTHMNTRALAHRPERAVQVRRTHALERRYGASGRPDHPTRYMQDKMARAALESRTPWGIVLLLWIAGLAWIAWLFLSNIATVSLALVYGCWIGAFAWTALLATLVYFYAAPRAARDLQRLDADEIAAKRRCNRAIQVFLILLIVGPLILMGLSLLLIVALVAACMAWRTILRIFVRLADDRR